MTNEQTQEAMRMKQYFPFRIVFGVIDRDTKEFSVYAKPTMHTANKLAREGHSVWVVK